MYKQKYTQWYICVNR